MEWQGKRAQGKEEEEEEEEEEEREGKKRSRRRRGEKNEFGEWDMFVQCSCMTRCLSVVF